MNDAPAPPPGGDAFAGLLGLTAERAGDGEAVVAGTVGAEHLNRHGTAHGAFLYAVADAAFALASNSREGAAVALTVTMQYFRPARPGDRVTAHAREVHLGRKVASYHVDVRVEDASVAAFTGTVYRLG